jgi:hypothetical protein
MRSGTAKRTSQRGSQFSKESPNISQIRHPLDEQGQAYGIIFVA